MSMSPVRQPKKKKNVHFWRACGYLAPYRRIVLTSVICAFFVGAIGTTGLTVMLPILRVLINGQTVQAWVDQQIAETRIGVKLSETEDLRVTSVSADGPAARAGITRGSHFFDIPDGSFTPIELAVRPDARQIAFRAPDGSIKPVPLQPLPAHLKFAHDLAAMLPVQPVKTIAVLFLILAGLASISNIIRFFQEYLSDKSAISAVMDIRRRLYDHVLHMPMSFFGLSGTSDVTSRLVQDSQALQDGFKSLVGQSVQEPIKAAFAFGLSMYLSWKLTLFIVVFAPLMAVVIKKFGKKMRRASRAALQRSAAMLGQIEGTLSGIRVVKAAGAERFERRRYSAIMEQLRHEMLKMARYEAYATPAMETVTLMVVGVVLIYASYLVLVAKSLDSASFFTLMACLAAIGESLRRVSKLNAVLARSNAAAGRIFEILDVPVERVRRGEKMRPLPNPLAEYRQREDVRLNLSPIQRDIRFEHITFAYANSPTNALDDVSLRVGKGTSVAVVGRNGSGKTTLLALLPRFYDPQQGRILIDDVDVRTATLRSLRRQIGIVTQEAVIFPGTIAENIAYGQPLASREEIESAARRAFAHDFILEKPQGYDTVLGEMGGQLSGGQRQRINIARAILRKTPILILDEATSQVDAESEHLIQQAIESIMKERTTFVIAHRFSTILSADTIVVMDRGRIVGQGQHEELLDSCQTYRQLYERQLVAV